ncbi:DICT sensory domain-containing protein [Nocardioides sp. GCM10027113]|uniref:DICT sensory domain-containing protein n=1 Tax=unclassified Nocardioides TaxID=2615069 RepID=UPI003615875F
MTTNGTEKQGVGQDSLTIGDLARKTGVAAGTLRMWETRHGFPQAERRKSGHRRYPADTVDLVSQVQRRREAGVRLDVAIAEALAGAEPATPSVFAEMRRRHPELERHRLRKSTLLALSWALEDECCARADRPVLIGSFQKERYYRAAAARWHELARVARAAVALADFPDGTREEKGVHLASLDEDAPMRREWTVVCDASDLPAMLTAFELPGQEGVPDRERLFEAMWTLEPRAVRDAARVCGRVAQAAGVAEATPLLYELAEEPPSLPLDPVGATTLFNRVVAYVDRMGS